MGIRMTVAQASRSRVLRIIAALGAAAVIASVGITACSGDALAPLSKNSAVVANQDGAGGKLSLESAGQFHNSFLDFVFPRMRSAVARGKRRAELCVVIAQAMRDFVVARNLGVNPGLIRNDIAGGECVSEKFARPFPGARLSLATDDVPVGELDIIVGEIALAAAENLPLSTLAGLIDGKVAYARAYLPAEEADVVAATAEIALSSASYWDQNYAYQERLLLEAAGLTQALTRSGGDSPRISASRSAAPRSGLIAPPARRSDDWMTDIENSSWYPKARKVAVSDIGGAVRGGISGWRGGWQGVVAGAAIEGGAASAGGFLREVFKPWTR